MNHSRPTDATVGIRLKSADLAARLAEVCPRNGLDLAGAVALPAVLPHAAQWRACLDEGRHGDLEYLIRDPEGRLDPTRRDPWAHSLLVFGQRYTAGWPAGDADPSAGGPAGQADDPHWTARVARYARGDDYHDIMLRDIRAVLADLKREWPTLAATASVDTGPYLEREYAWLGGLGFLGRNTCLIHEKLGSGMFLGVALTNLMIEGLPQPGTPANEPLYAVTARRRHATPTVPWTRCGTCTRCVEACPTSAILPGGGLDAGRCLSTWTIERQGRVPAGRDADQGGILFGCDICQAVCPWNHHAAAMPVMERPRGAYEALPAHEEMRMADLVDISDSAFRDRFRRTPLWRAHPEGLRRNAVRVLANIAKKAP